MAGGIAVGKVRTLETAGSTDPGLHVIVATLAYRTVRLLFGRRQQPARWLFAAAAVPLAILALMVSICDFPPVPYLVLAGICLLQAVFPTLLGWLATLGIYAAGSVVYLYMVAKGGSYGDGVPFLLAVTACAGATVAMALVRPRLITDASDT